MELKRIKDLPEEGVLTASGEVIQKLAEMGFNDEESEQNDDSEDDVAKDQNNGKQ
ncbi:hypothetical protein [Helicobacter sp. 12S02232-10]|uniref:hypothetical protein n=1 Tax=Helicobacter sp. 12S02232-10 TaxID=1476197 RepID=UPI0015DD743F|nr:hypothetical protein [Helicobacter sp. 12S02232-10]